MGKYSNVNASSLSSVANTALNELNRNSLQTVRNNLSKNSILYSAVSKSVTDQLNNIENSKAISGSIAVIKEMLEDLKSAASYISKYQDLERENALLDAKKYTYETDYYYVTSASGARVRRGTKTKKLNQSVVNKMNNNLKSMQKYEEMIDQLLTV